MIRAHTKRLKVLLSKGWKGPHGFYGRFTFKNCDR
jgi:hypothetical protein